MIDKNLLQDVVICRKNDTILEVARILRDTKSRHLIVVDEEDKPLGIISTVDISNRVVSEELNSAETSAEEIMSKPIEVVDVKESFEDAYKKMSEKGTYSIPVVENHKLIGSLSFNQLFYKVGGKNENRNI